MSWQTGRSEDTFAAKRARQPGTELEIDRQYLLVYGWIHGIDASEAADQLGLVDRCRRKFLDDVTETVIGDLAEAGFQVLDMKPAHVIVRLTPGGSLLCRPNGQLVYALVDYELLEREKAPAAPDGTSG